VPERNKTLLQAHWEKIRCPEGCWEWQGAKLKAGYAHINFEGKSTTMTRWIYREFIGPIPEGYTIDHLCRNVLCVNPNHLEAVPHAENCARSGRRGRTGVRVFCKRGHAIAGKNIRMYRMKDPVTKERTWGKMCWICHRARMDRYEAKRRGLKRAGKS